MIYTTKLSRVLGLISVVVIGFFNGTVHADISLQDKGKKLAVFTDYEADDSIAIALLLQYLKNNGVHDSQDFMFGALLSNQYRKKALVQKFVNLFGYTGDTVYAGTGGLKEPFEQEGRNILDQNLFDEFALLDQKYLATNDPQVHQDDESINQFRNMLENAPLHSVDVVILANPIDFVKALAGNESLLYKLRDIYMMGGWFRAKPSFNWSIYIASVIELLQLMQMAQGHPYSPSLTLFSSHMFADQFNGYVNHGKFPAVIEAFDTNQHPVVNHLRHMVKNWDDSMTVIKDGYTDSEKEWRLEMVDRIGKENIGRQFAPADPATMLGYLYPEKFIVQKRPVALHFKHDGKGYVVDCQPDVYSNIYLVEQISLPFFNDKLFDLMSFAR